MPELVLHALPPSHPCHAVIKALKLKGLEYEHVDMPIPHTAPMEEIYGEGRGTVPGMLIDGEPVHGSRAILARLEELAPEPRLYPGEAVREAERWGDEELQQLGRNLGWGALHFRPEALAALGGGDQLDPAGTDFAIKYIRAAWKYHGISAQRLAEDLAGLPAKLDHVDALAAEGVIGGDQPNAADLQIGSTLNVLATIGDLDALMADRPARELATKFFDPRPGRIPAGAFPRGWVPER